MTWCKAEGVVLRRFDYSDTSQIAWVYTRDFGKEKLIAKGAKRMTKNALGALDPLTHIHLVFLDRKTEGLRTLTEWELIDGFPGLREDLDRLYLASYAVELVNELTEDGEPNERIFEILLRVFKRLCENGDHQKLIFAFELAFLRAVGHVPELLRCAHCGHDPWAEEGVYFSVREGGVLCGHCGRAGLDAVPASRGAIETMSALAQGGRAGVDRLQLGREAAAEMRRLMNMHLRGLIGKDLKLSKHLGTT